MTQSLSHALKKTNTIISKGDFTERFYQQVPTLPNQAKVSPEDFFIPKIDEFGLLLKNNYKVPQLKKICKSYKQRVTGKKSELIYNIYNYLYYSFYAMQIQKAVRGFLQRKLNKSYGPGFLKREICTNQTDFFTLEELKDTNYEQFYSYKDKDGFIYGFNILSLYNLIDKSEAINPYNRNPFPVTLVPAMRNHIRLSRVMGINIDIEMKEPNDEITPLKRLELRTLALFQTIDSLGNYSDPTWFLSLSNERLITYMRELYDIWNYRAQLAPEVKLSICPPVGDPFRGTNMNYLTQLNSFNLKKLAISTMEKLVNNGNSRDSQSLGAFYVLASLTLVNSHAANALPWLYHSVAHFT